MRDKNSEDDKVDKNAWMMTYADMVTLLLTFFVLLIAYANYSQQKFWQVITSTRMALTGGKGVLEGTSPSMTQSFIGSRSRDKAASILDEMVESVSALDENIEYEFTENGGVILVLPDEFYFDSGSAGMKANALPILKQIAQVVKKALEEVPKSTIQVNGHSDNTPIHTDKYADNWELSTARAVKVLRMLMEEGIDEKILSAAGYADKKPAAKGKDTREANNTAKKRAKNRRVEIEINAMTKMTNDE